MDWGVVSGAQDHLKLSIPFPSGLPDVAMKHRNRVHFNCFLKDWWPNNTCALFLIKCHLKKCVFVHIKNTLHDVLQDYLYCSCAIQCPLYVECKTSILQSKLKQYRFVAHRVQEGVGIDQHKRLWIVIWQPQMCLSPEEEGDILILITIIFFIHILIFTLFFVNTIE